MSNLTKTYSLIRERYMKFGFFDDINNEYVITSPETPLPWINYLGSQDFFRLISNTSGGYCFYKDAKLMRLTRYRYNNSPMDCGGHYFYIKDGSSIWNPGWQPVKAPLDSYKCRHGLGYTVFESSKNGLDAVQEVFVPLHENCELTRITLMNRSSETKEIDLYSYVEFCLWDAQDDTSNFQRNFSIGEVEVEGSTIYHKTEYRERRNHYAMFHVNKDICGFDTSRDEFAGIYTGADRPRAVEAGVSYNSIAHGWAPVGSHHLKITLAPGKLYSCIFILGYCENPYEHKFSAPGVINKEPADRLISLFGTDDQFDAALHALRVYWKDLLSICRVDSGNEKLDRAVNIWNQYQCMVTFNMSRSASYYESGLGNTQFPDGSAYHQYQPLTKRGNTAVGSGFNDDPLWLIACVSAYIKETGDFSILDEQCTYDNNENNTAPLLDHLRKSFGYTSTHLGPHSLPLIGRADWNDCMNLNCFSEHPGESFQITGPSEGPVAESVFIAGMYVKYGIEFADILTHLGCNAEAAEIMSLAEDMRKTVLDAGWDGEWFRRAYDAFGHPVGSSECEEGRIFIEPQGMCVMAGIGAETGEAETALRSVEKHLDTEYGIMLHQPAYTKYHLELGEITSYPPGYKENAGIFCHCNPWIVISEAMLGHGDRAFDVYRKTNPVFLEDISEIHRTEPYAYCQMIAGRDAATHGEGKNSWLTGTAAWSFVAVSQYILGIRPELDGLRIDPCLPADIDSFSCVRRFRGSAYHISVENKAGGLKGKAYVTVNGKPAGNLIPVPDEPADIDVRIIIS